MKIDDTFVLRQIAGDYVILPTGKTTLNFNGMITVNEQGAFLWKLLQQETTTDALVAAILEEYETDEATARADVEDFLEVLRRFRIIR
ncbi:MAG: PqqD family protein [Oscillospiraceae bacterium]|nr:PqqD family protein [Oscillospiraceae bacterium]